MSGKQKKAEHANTITALIAREAEYQKVKAALLGSDLGQSGLFTLNEMARVVGLPNWHTRNMVDQMITRGVLDGIDKLGQVVIGGAQSYAKLRVRADANALLRQRWLP
jgi:hypothetical protein